MVPPQKAERLIKQGIESRFHISQRRDLGDEGTKRGYSGIRLL